MPVKPIPENFPRVSPYLIVKDVAETIEFLKYVFDAKEREKMILLDGTIDHAEVSIGDSVIMMGKAFENYPPQPAMIYVYVENTDAAYKRALEKEAVSVMESSPESAFGGGASCGSQGILDGTTKFNSELRKANWDKYLKTAFEAG